MEIDGVLANMPQAMLNVLGDPRPWTELDSLAGVPYLPPAKALKTPDFYLDIPGFSDIDYEMLQNGSEDGSLALFCLANRPNLTVPALPEQRSAMFQTMCWLEGRGLRSWASVRPDTTSMAAKIWEIQSDMHVTADPESFTALKAEGMPVWLMDRPWNQHVRTNRRLHSVAEMLQALEVQDRTQPGVLRQALARVAMAAVSVYALLGDCFGDVAWC